MTETVFTFNIPHREMEGNGTKNGCCGKNNAWIRMLFKYVLKGYEQMCMGKGKYSYCL